VTNGVDLALTNALLEGRLASPDGGSCWVAVQLAKGASKTRRGGVESVGTAAAEHGSRVSRRGAAAAR
jgi:hypothetical protein